LQERESESVKISLDNRTAGYTIRSYRPGEVQVGGRSRETDATVAEPIVLTESFIITPEQLIADWPPEDFGSLDHHHFEALAELRPQVVLLGSGERLRFPEASLLKPLVDLSIGVEVMDTGAACRTYNLLAAEGRLVARRCLFAESGKGCHRGTEDTEKEISVTLGRHTARPAEYVILSPVNPRCPPCLCGKFIRANKYLELNKNAARGLEAAGPYQGEFGLPGSAFRQPRRRSPG
jgi:uncharacterized protein